MLFKFSCPRELRFWGVNTLIPLDIAFITNENVIVKIDRIKPLLRDIVSSDVNCLMAIEANQDYFASNGIEKGYKIELEDGDDGQLVLFKK